MGAEGASRGLEATEGMETLNKRGRKRVYSEGTIRKALTRALEVGLRLAAAEIGASPGTLHYWARKLGAKLRPTTWSKADGYEPEEMQALMDSIRRRGFGATSRESGIAVTTLRGWAEQRGVQSPYKRRRRGKKR